MTPDAGSIFGQGTVLVPGFVSPAKEERILLRIAAAPWMTGLRRRVQHYGYRCDYRRSARPAPAAPLPRWTHPARADGQARFRRRCTGTGDNARLGASWGDTKFHDRPASSDQV